MGSAGSTGGDVAFDIRRRLPAHGLAHVLAVAGARGGLIAPILIAPLSIPVLIFGTGSITATQSGAAMLLLAALSLTSVALAPFVAALAISSAED